MRKLIGILAALLVIAVLCFFLVLPGIVGRDMNKVLTAPPYVASEQARKLHESLVIVDLHADSLLWDRDLLERGSWGHVDVPRLIEGNVAIQAFTIVTKTPRGMNIENNDASSDNITLLAVAERWPMASWKSLTERALYQARRLHETADKSQGKFILIQTAADLDLYLANRRAGTTAGFLGIEGSHALDGRIENLDRLFDAGVRMVGISHFFDNEAGGSAHGTLKGGLTEFGKEIVRHAESRRMMIDLAHASARVIEDVLAMSTRPIVVSHTGVKGTCNNTRNLSDDQLKAIAATGGIIGIGYWDSAVCGTDARAVAKAIKHAVSVAGIEHVGLGSDFDGAVDTPFDTTGLVLVTDALLAEGFSDAEVRKIMGENAIRVLRETL